MVTIRAKGALYVTYNAIKYLFLLGVLSLVVFAFIDGKPFSSVEVLQIFGDVFLVLGAVVLLTLLVLQTCEIIRYKLVIDENGIYIAANRDFMLIRHKDINVSYEKIKAIQYKQYLRPDLIQEGMFFFFAIYIYREEDFCEKRKNEEYLLTMWFSKKQVKKIKDMIAFYAEKQNGYSVEILPDDIM